MHYWDFLQSKWWQYLIMISFQGIWIKWTWGGFRKKDSGAHQLGPTSWNPSVMRRELTLLTQRGIYYNRNNPKERTWKMVVWLVVYYWNKWKVQSQCLLEIPLDKWPKYWSVFKTSKTLIDSMKIEPPMTNQLSQCKYQSPTQSMTTLLLPI